MSVEIVNKYVMGQTLEGETYCLNYIMNNEWKYIKCLTIQKKLTLILIKIYICYKKIFAIKKCIVFLCNH